MIMKHRHASLLFIALLAAPTFAAEKSAPPEPRTAREIAWSSAQPFALGAADLLAWGESVKATESDDVVLLLDEAKYRFEGDGRHTLTHRLVYVVETQGGAEDWASTAALWSPWNQQRPEIRARVVTRDGIEHRLDPNTIDDAPADADSATIYSDQRVLRAPLPAVAPGAVVERLIVTREKTPLFDAGVSLQYRLSGGIATRLTHLEVDAPEALPLKFVARLTDVQPTRESIDGRVRTVYQAGPFAASDEIETSVPSDVTQVPIVSFSTGVLWSHVAKRYHEIVEQQLASADVAKLVRDAVGDAKERDAIIRRLVARLHRDVRYTGVELAEASIVPRAPKETLTRRFGDCKDKSALLVAMLRQAGIPASIALLGTGPGLDIEPELYGFGPFDHAIVFVPGERDIWIDATDEMGTIDTLPLPSQGRLALVASPETTALSRTPESTSAQNRAVETREFRLAEIGKSTVVETTEAFGSIERGYRSGYDGADTKALRESIEDYARNSYLSEKVASYTYTEPRDLSKPFSIRIEMHEAGRGASDLSEAIAVIFPARLLDRLAWELTEEEEKDASGKTKAREPRKHDFVFYEPFTMEWVYRIVAPSGFSARPLPESATVGVGTATLTKEFRRESNEVVLGTLRFDTGKRRLTPEEFETFRKSAIDLAKAEPIIIGFDQIGYAHLQKGEMREALAEFRRLETRHPREGIHHAQIALALLEAGLGDAARKEIDEAVKRDPASAVAHQLRGWIYQHDSLGRLRKMGFDLDESVKSYRKAKELDSNDLNMRANLAIVLEFDANGNRYTSGARLAEAIAEYEAIRADLEDDTFLHNLVIALLRAGRFAEMKRLAEENPSLPQRASYLLIAEIVESPSRDLAQLAAKVVPEIAQRRSVLASVADTLVQLRRYPDAVTALLEAAKGAPNAAELRARADLFRKARRHEEIQLAADEPTSVVKAAIKSLYDVDTSIEEYQTLFSADIRRALQDEALRTAFETSFRQARGEGLRDAVEPDLIPDIALAMTEFAVEGSDDLGYRILTRGVEAHGAVDPAMFVVKEDGAYRLATTSGSLYGAGVRAQKHLDRGDLDSARKWLDWAREQTRERVGDDPTAGRPLLHFWKKGQQGSEKEIREAIAALLLEGPKEVAKRALEIHQAGAESAASAADRLKYEIALAGAYGAIKDAASLTPVAARIAAQFPDAEGPFVMRCFALSHQKKYDEMKALASQRLERDPADPMALRMFADAAAQSGNLGESLRVYRRLIDSGKALPHDYNNFAWYSLYAPPVTQAAIDEAQRAVSLTGSNVSIYLHTLATLYAEQGKTSEAKGAIWQAMEASGSLEPASYDSYVLGRIAEEYGIRDAAIAAYRRVEPENEKDRDSPVSTWRLAQQRLKGLGVK